MEPIEDQLRRLLKSASAAPADEPASAPYGFATRVLAAARDNAQPQDAAMTIRVAWQALGCAVALMTITIVCNLSAISSSITASATDEYSVTDSAIRLALAE